METSLRLSLMVALAASVGAVYCGLQGVRFVPGAANLPLQGPRINPNPKWVPGPWKADADRPFRAVRQEVEPVLNGIAFDERGLWAGRARRALNAWKGDCQNPIALYRLSAYALTAKAVDQNFAKASQYHEIMGMSRLGWDILESPPPSYEFARMGYLVTRNDGCFHKFGDLPFRLLEKDPGDRSVLIALVDEYVWRKPIPAFEQKMFRALARARQDRRWKVSDDYFLAKAHWLYGQKNKKRGSFETAIGIVQAMLPKLPPGWKKEWYDKFLEVVRIFQKDPNFGMPKYFDYVDDQAP